MNEGAKPASADGGAASSALVAAIFAPLLRVGKTLPQEQYVEVVEVETTGEGDGGRGGGRRV